MPLPPSVAADRQGGHSQVATRGVTPSPPERLLVELLSTSRPSAASRNGRARGTVTSVAGCRSRRSRDDLHLGTGGLRLRRRLLISPSGGVAAVCFSKAVKKLTAATPTGRCSPWETTLEGAAFSED